MCHSVSTLTRNWLTNLGIGPIPSIYSSEAFPLSHRELGAAFTICVNNAVGSILSLSFPPLIAKTTPRGCIFHRLIQLVVHEVARHRRVFECNHDILEFEIYGLSACPRRIDSFGYKTVEEQNYQYGKSCILCEA